MARQVQQMSQEMERCIQSGEPTAESRLRSAASLARRQNPALSSIGKTDAGRLKL